MGTSYCLEYPKHNGSYSSRIQKHLAIPEATLDPLCDIGVRWVLDSDELVAVRTYQICHNRLNSYHRGFPIKTCYLYHDDSV